MLAPEFRRDQDVLAALDGIGVDVIDDRDHSPDSPEAQVSLGGAMK
jgi:hypothetical protein